MRGLRSTKGDVNITDGLAKLSLNQRAMQLIDTEKPTASTVKKAAAKTTSVVKRTAEAAAQAVIENSRHQAGGDLHDETAEKARNLLTEANREAGAIAATAVKKGVRKGNQIVAGKVVKRSMIAASKRASAAKTVTNTSIGVSRFNILQARTVAAAAHLIRTIATTVVATVTGTKIITITGVLLALILAISSIFAFLAPATLAACTPQTGGQIDPAKVPQTSVAGYGQEQLINAAHIIKAAQDKGLNTREQTIGVMTAMGESSLRVLNHGDAAGPDSRGLFQQRDNWGSLQDRLDPYISAGKFFDALIKKVSVKERETLAPTLIAHKVQVNQDPYHYEKYWEPATAVVAALTGVESSVINGGLSCNTALIPGEIGLDGWAKPANGPITSHFGPRAPLATPAGYTSTFHYGIDFNADGCGGPIWAARDGKVTRIIADMIEVDHGNNLTTRYMHSWPNDILVSQGQEVKAGEQIARTGAAGFSTGCHLHFEIRVNNVPTDPYPILTGAGLTF